MRKSNFIVLFVAVSLVVLSLFQNCSGVSLSPVEVVTKSCVDSHLPQNIASKYLPATNEYEFYALENVNGSLIESTTSVYDWKMDSDNDGTFDINIPNVTKFKMPRRFFSACNSYKVQAEYSDTCSGTKIQFPTGTDFSFIPPSTTSPDTVPAKVKRRDLAGNQIEFYAVDSMDRIITGQSFQWFADGALLGSGNTIRVLATSYTTCSATRIEAKYAACSTEITVPQSYSGRLNTALVCTPPPAPTVQPPVVYGPVYPTDWGTATSGSVFGVTSIQAAFPSSPLESQYNFKLIYSGQTLSYKFNSNQIATTNPRGGSFNVRTSPSAGGCACYASISVHAGDFNPTLGKCRGWTYGDTGAGNELIYITSATPSPNICRMDVNKDYYLNIYCGVTNPTLYFDLILAMDSSQVAMTEAACGIRAEFTPF